MEDRTGYYFKKEIVSKNCCGSCKKLDIVECRPQHNNSHILVLGIEGCNYFHVKADLSNVCQYYEPRDAMEVFVSKRIDGE